MGVRVGGWCGSVRFCPSSGAGRPIPPLLSPPIPPLGRTPERSLHVASPAAVIVPRPIVMSPEMPDESPLPALFLLSAAISLPVIGELLSMIDSFPPGDFDPRM